MSLLSSFADELVYGPLPVIGFVGSPELHAPLSKLLNGVLGDEPPPEGAICIPPQPGLCSVAVRRAPLKTADRGCGALGDTGADAGSNFRILSLDPAVHAPWQETNKERPSAVERCPPSPTDTI